MVGQGSVNHNSRKFHAKNTDPERSHLNVTYCQENIKTVYHELFDEALERYNAKQTRADRRIEDYYEKIRSGKQEKPFHEIILQVGNRDDMSADSEEGQLAAAVLDEYMKGFQERNPQLRVFSAHLHMDEATPHLHIDFVPFTTGSKRGLDTRVSLKQALAAQGFKGGTRGDTEWSQWVRSEKEQLSLVMERHGIEWEDKGTHDKHLSVLDYKKEQRAKEIAVLETVKAEKESQVESQERRLKELAPVVKNMERLAADFSADPEEILPEPGTLETGRAYREKKAKPLLAQIVKVLRSLYLAYVELRGKFERLQGDYGRVRESNARLSDRLQEVKLENKALRQVSADYERVKRVFGLEQVEVAVQADKQREQAEKGRKRPRRSVDRGER
ncbi:MAG TPA: plasmid recombination protein [Candidatus Agathobaculum intestinipullorum]|nr:plasmid recombination protein [Candidatus Agathobaculum intestinipullorum]